MAGKEIVCVQNTLKIMRFYGILPEKGREFNPGKNYYCKLVIMASFGAVVLIGSFLHLLKNMSTNIYTSLDLDLMYIFSLGTTFLFGFAFFYKSKALIELFVFFSDFEEFGKPIDFDDDNEFYNKFSKFFYANLEILVTSIIFFSARHNFRDCKELNSKYDLDEVCGLFAYTWMPFDIDYFPVKQIFSVVQLLGLHYMYILAGGCGSGLIFETVQHVRIRIRHVSHLFREAVAEKNPGKCREKFNFAARYHAVLLGLEEKLNGAFGICMFTHLAITAPILGIGAFAVLYGGSFAAFMVSVGWFGGLVMNCVAGQWLQDECLAVGTDLYQADWHHCSEDIKKDIMVVIQRSWTPIYLRAASFGVMDYKMFVGVVKASYSYITLLAQVD